MLMDTSRVGTTPAPETEEDAEPALPRGSEAPELLAGYLAKISRDELLTHRQELALSRRAHSGDRRARRQLIEKNLRLVVSVAKRYLHLRRLVDTPIRAAGGLGQRPDREAAGVYGGEAAQDSAGQGRASLRAG